MKKEEITLIENFKEIHDARKMLEKFGFFVSVPSKSGNSVFRLMDTPLGSSPISCKKSIISGAPSYRLVGGSEKFEIEEKAGYFFYEHSRIKKKLKKGIRARILSLLGKGGVGVTAKIRKSYPEDQDLVSMYDTLRPLTLKKNEQIKAQQYETASEARDLERKQIENIDQYLRDRYPKTNFFIYPHINKEILEKID